MSHRGAASRTNKTLERQRTAGGKEAEETRLGEGGGEGERATRLR